MSEPHLLEFATQPSSTSQQSQLVELTRMAFQTQEDPELNSVSPPSKGWVNAHFTSVVIGAKKIRICLADGCTKQYAAGSSTRTFKDHWHKQHKDCPRSIKTRFLFHDQLDVNRLVKMVIALHLDYSIVDKPEFRKYVESLNPNRKVLSRQTLANLINYSKVNLANKVRQKLGDAESVALTFDIWSARKGSRGFGCITAHYINADGRIENLTLHFERMKFPHDARTISKFIRKTIEANDLQGRIASITTDNASNNISGIRMLEDSLGLHWLDLGFIHYKCVAHIIDLGIKEAMKNLRDTVAPVRDAVMAIRSSRKRKERFMSKQEEMIEQGDQSTSQVLELAEDVDHRWNSTWVLLDRAYLLRKAVDYMILSKGIELPPIDWEMIRGVIKFLEPFNEATKRLCRASDVTISAVSYIVPRLIEHCVEYEDKPNEWLRGAAKSMRTKLTDYETELYHPVVDLAYFLDPRYKTLNLSDEHSKLVVNRVNLLIERMPRVDQIVDFNLSRRESIVGQDSDNEENFDEVKNYLQSRRLKLKTDVVAWWKNNMELYPKLSAVARKILPIQGTSVASERVFSVAGDVDTKSRNRLSDSSVENIVQFKSWMQFLQIE